MKTKFAMFAILAITCGAILGFGCSNNGGVGSEEGAGVEPVKVHIPTKILWSQETPKDVSAPTSPLAEEKASASKAIIGPYSDEEERKEMTVGYFVSNPDGTGITRLTPTKNSAVALGPGLAPNGDFFYFTQAGIWISNFKNTAPKLLISARKLFTNFDEGGEMLLAWNNDLLLAVKEHLPSCGDVSLNFVPTGGDGGEYTAVLLIPVQYTKKDSSDELNALLALRYDSKTGTLSHIIPFMSSLKNNKGYNSNLSFEGGSLILFPTYKGIYWDKSADKLVYKIMAISADKTYYDTAVAYDPVTAKHTIIYNKKRTGDEPAFGNIKFISANLIAETPLIKLEKDTCATTYTPKVVGYKKVGTVEAGKKTASCMQELLKGKTITLMKPAGVDITDKIAKEEELFNAIIQTTVENPPVASIDLGLVKQFDPLVSYGDNPIDKTENYHNKDIVCKDYEGETKCFPQEFNKCQDKENCYTSYNLSSYTYLNDRISFLGETKRGNDILSALYTVDLSRGTVTEVYKEDETIDLAKSSLTPTSKGELFIYGKSVKNTNFIPFYKSLNIYVYDPSSGATAELTGFLPTLSYPSFACSDGVKSLECHGISYDRKYAFVTIRDEMDRLQTYAKDLTPIFAAIGEAAGSAKFIQKDESSAAGTALPAPQAGSLLGEGWVKISPDVEHKAITYELLAFDGERAVWSGNKEGFNYLYYNEPFKDVTPKRVDPHAYNNHQHFISLAMGKGLSGTTSLVPPPDMDSSYKCGTASDSGTAYCEKSFEVCIDGVCKDMF